MYRAYIQPLTEKTKSKPFDGEILINTENGIVSVTNNDKIVSSLKDIKADIELSIRLINLIKTNFNSIDEKINDLEEKYNFENNRVQESLNILEELESLMIKLREQMENIENINEDNFIKIRYYLKECWNILPEYFKWLATIFSYQRKIEELEYIESLMKVIKEKLNSELTLDDNNNVIYQNKNYKINTDDNKNLSINISEGTLGNKIKETIDDLNDKVFEKDYNNFCNTLKTNYDNLKKTYSEIIVKLSFNV